MVICTKGTHSRVLIDALDYHLDRHLLNIFIYLVIGQHSVNTQLTVSQVSASSNQHPMTCLQKFVDSLPRCVSSVDQCQPRCLLRIHRGPTKGTDLGYINRHPTEEGPNRPLYCTHDPLCLVNLLSILSKLRKQEPSTLSLNK